MIKHTNSEGCFEILKNVPLQNSDEEITIVFGITIFAMILMVILLSKHIRDIFMNAKVFPMMSLTATPLLMLHVFTLNVKLAKVVKLLIKRLFEILTLDFFDLKSRSEGSKFERESFVDIGY